MLPILTARIVMQLAAGAKLLAVDLQAAEDRRLFNAATKALAVAIAAAQALACVASGMYGSLSVVSSVLVLAQLVAGSLAVIALDDLVAKGNGVGVGEWRCCWRANGCRGHAVGQRERGVLGSPERSSGERTTPADSAVLGYFDIAARVHGCRVLQPVLSLRGESVSQNIPCAPPRLPSSLLPSPPAGVNLFVCASIAETVLGGFFRPSLLDVARMVTTLALLAAVAYAVGCGTRFQLKYRQVPTGTSLPPPPQYPIRLLYSLHMPLLIAAALLAHVALATQVLFRLWPGNPLAAVTGTWALSTPEAPASVPTGGLAFWLSPPASTWEALGNPFRTLFYGTFLFAACTMAAEAWAASAGPAAREEARKIDEKGLTMQGCTTRTDIAKRLSAAITASIPLGGAALAILAIAGDVLGVIGSGACGATPAVCCACVSCGTRGVCMCHRRESSRPAGPVGSGGMRQGRALTLAVSSRFRQAGIDVVLLAATVRAAASSSRLIAPAASHCSASLRTALPLLQAPPSC